VLSQLVDGDGDDVPDELVFQTDLGAKESKTFTVEAGTRPTLKADDFKVYGASCASATTTSPGRTTASRTACTDRSGDLEEGAAHLQRYRRLGQAHQALVVNEWYMTDDYHRDNGDGADFYSVKQVARLRRLARLRGRQAGRVAQLRALARADARAAPRGVRARLRAVRRRLPTEGHETKRITLDAGTTSTASPARSRSRAAATARRRRRHRQAREHRSQDRQAVDPTWEKVKDDDSSLGCAVVCRRDAASRSPHRPRHVPGREGAPGVPFVYYMGRTGASGRRRADAGAWTKAVQEQARDIARP
jgi:hypothetical protein